MKKIYKIAIVGLGSIGKRHLININKVIKDRNKECSIDLVRRNGSTPLESEIQSLVNKVFLEEDTIPKDYDVIFITNPTHLHYQTVKKYSTHTKSMFIEKPVFDKTILDLSDLGLIEDGIYYVACPLRYTKIIQYIKDNISFDDVYSIRSICSSYLPDWRPGTDYRDSYSAHKDQGGGVSIDLIHEWDYLIHLFGKPKAVTNYRGKFSELEIDSDDLSIYIAQYENKLLELHLDYFGRKAIRELQFFKSEDTIIADLINSEIRFLKENKVISFKEERNGYQIREIEHFFDILEGIVDNDNDINIAINTLKIAKEGTLE